MPSAPNFARRVADGATETSFSGLWAQILVDAFISQRLPKVKQETMLSLSEAGARRHRRPPQAAALVRAGEAGARRVLVADGADDPRRRQLARCVGDSCLFHVRPQQTIRAFPYHQPDQFNNHPALLSTRHDSSVEARSARGKWKNGDYFLLMTDALAHFFLSQRRLRAHLAADGLDQASFADLVARARGERICRNDDVTLLRIVPIVGEGQGGVA
ncbi:MAG: protein phosphatase 2C domain-containing protein [Anaerolineae bacterium]